MLLKHFNLIAFATLWYAIGQQAIPKQEKSADLVTVTVTSPSFMDLYSECSAPEAQIRLKNAGPTPISAHLAVELPSGATILPKDSNKWTKSSGQTWTMPILLPVASEQKILLPLEIGDKSGMHGAKIRVSLVTAENQTARTAESDISERSATPLSTANGQSSASDLIKKRVLTPLMTDCGLSTYYLSGELVIDQDLTFDNASTQFIVAPDTRIIVKKGVELTLNNALFTSCGKWSGIYVEPQGKVTMDRTNIEQTDRPITYLDNELAASSTPIEAKVYPNPSSDKAVLDLGGMVWEGRATVRIEDGQGRSQTVSYRPTASGKEILLDTGQLPNGFYLVKVSLPDGSSRTAKMLVEHR